MPILKNSRHELYCRGVAEGKTSDQAHTDAGYAPNRCNAARLKSNKNIQARILELQERSFKRHDITVDRILEEYAKIGFSDPRKLFDADGNPIPPHKLATDIAGAVTGIDWVTRMVDGEEKLVPRYKVADKRPALRDMGQHHDMFTEDITIKAEVEHKTVSDLELARRLGFLLAKGADAVSD